MQRLPENGADVLYCLRLSDGSFSHRNATVVRVINADLGIVDLAVASGKRDERFENGTGDTPPILIVSGVEHAIYHRPSSWHYLGEVP